MMISLLPDPLSIEPLQRSSEGQEEHEDVGPSPNLMPFSINYTGPANVDGYLICHSQGASSSSSSALATNGNGSGSLDSASDGQVYSHFRGRRIFRTALPLPTGWSGRVCEIHRRKTYDATYWPTDGGHATVAGQSTTGAKPSTPSATTNTDERAELLRRKEQRRLAAAAASSSRSNGRASGSGPQAKKVNTGGMGGFSMDDDEDDDEDEGQGQEEGSDYDEGAEEEEEQQHHEEAKEEDYYVSPSPPPPRPVEEALSPLAHSHPSPQSTKPAHQPQPQPSPSHTTSLHPLATFTALHIWSPDGPLDKGDEELVKILGGEWDAVRRVLMQA